MNQLNALTARGLKPVGVLAAGRACGDRLRYISGCRCDLCRRANSSYESARQKARREGDWNGIVSAEKARSHILKLSKMGVGRRAIASASDVSETVLCEIRAGKKTSIRARTERRILAVTREMASDAALIPAARTWLLINALRNAGFCKQQIARHLGQKGTGLQLGKERITVRNAFLVEKLHRELIASDQALTSAAPTWQLIKALLAEGYTSKQLARHLGFETGELKLGKARVTLRDARHVERLHLQLTT